MAPTNPNTKTRPLPRDLDEQSGPSPYHRPPDKSLTHWPKSHPNACHCNRYKYLGGCQFWTTDPDSDGENVDGQDPESQKKKNKKTVVVRRRKNVKGGNELRLRFARKTVPVAGRDDPVEDGRELAGTGDVLPSDGAADARVREEKGGKRRVAGTGAGVRVVSREEKELDQLRREGILRDGRGGGERGITMESLVRDEPVYTLRFVPGKKRGGKGKGKDIETEGDKGIVVEQAQEQPYVVSGAVEEEIPVVDEDALAEETVEDIPECCWAKLLADMEADGWVPVVDDDMASVAESWVVMQDDAELEGTD